LHPLLFLPNSSGGARAAKHCQAALTFQQKELFHKIGMEDSCDFARSRSPTSSVDRLLKLHKLAGMIGLPVFFRPSRIAPSTRARDGATLDENRITDV